MSPRRSAFALVAANLALALPLASAATKRPRAPEFPSQDAARWIGPPQSMAELRGRVVLLDVWTFDCINCVRTIPWVKEVARRYEARGLTVVGVHTPEFDHERNREAVAARARKHSLDFSHFLDNDYQYWNALDNQYWPAIYLVDRCGQLRSKATGEVHVNEATGRQLEQAIESLLAETPLDCGSPK